MSFSTSAKTGFAPVCNTAFAVATKVRFGTITSSFLPIPNAFKERNNAEVALETPIENFDLTNFEKAFSNSINFGPSVSNFSFRALEIIFLSEEDNDGINNGTRIFGLLKESFLFDSY